MEQILPAVREVVEKAIAYANEPASLEPPVPDRLATREDAIAAIRAGVWWGRRKGQRPGVALGTHHDHPYEVDTHPIAALGPLILSPHATREALDATQVFVMGAFGKRGPKSDSIKFWTSRAMQRQHGYTIDGAGENRYVYRHRKPDV